MKTFEEKIKISNSLIFRLFLYCFLTTVFIELVFEFPVWWGYCFLLAALAILVFNPRNRVILLLSFCFLGIFLGWWRVGWSLEKINHQVNNNFSGYFYVSKNPEVKDDYQKIVACPAEKTIENDHKNKVIFVPKCSEKFLILRSLDKNYSLGEVFEVNCQLETPENKHSKFNYIKFLAKDNIYKICQKPQIQEINPMHYQLNSYHKSKIFIYTNIFNLKSVLEEKIKRNFSYPESAYLSGLLLGGEDRLPIDVQENFRRTGTTHTVAVSGFNITILASFFMWFGILIGFWRQQAFWLSAIGILFFVLMIGSPSSAVRAAVMGVLILWASKKGRLTDSVQMIILAGVLMIFVSPLILIYDVGFQLSFLASLSIILIYGPLSEKFKIKNDFLGLKSILLVTISAQLGVLGILIYNFETFSPISLLANLIILPLVPLIMLMGFLVIVVSFFIPFLAQIIALPTQLALNLEIGIIEKLAEIPWASVEIGDIGLMGLIIYYLIFILIIARLRKKLKR